MLVGIGRSQAKRQRTGAVHALADLPSGIDDREAAWTAVVLHRFSLPESKAWNK